MTFFGRPLLEPSKTGMSRTHALAASDNGELLYNHIRLPAQWPPETMDPGSYEPVPVPYLQSPPDIIPIDTGRQLFVDDFLIENSSLQRNFHKARKIDSSPVFQPETPLEMGEEGLPVACPKDGGICWDPQDNIFKMWYEAAWIGTMAYATSRDGFHWHRPDREAFIPASRIENDWDRGYVQSVGGICTIVGDQLRFYYTGFRGDPENLHPEGMKSGMYAHGSTGMAVLRRDGFVSVTSGETAGRFTTRPVIFTGNRLFVNVDCPEGELRVEILKENHSVISTFSAEHCNPVTTDRTIYPVSWNGNHDLSALAGRKVRFRFYLKKGDIYAFWVSPDQGGASYGFTAAGGPGFKSAVDDAGEKAYKVAASFPVL